MSEETISGQSISMTESIVSPVAERKSRTHFSLGSIILVLGIVSISAVFGLALARQNKEQPTSGPAPEFTLTTFDGQTLKLSDLTSKVVVVNFWASWCGPCREEAPALQATWDVYKLRDDVVFIGIAYADNGPRSLEFIKEFGITYLNGPDLGTRISESYNIQGVPETFVIDQKGHIFQFIYAGITQSKLSTIIENALAKE